MVMQDRVTWSFENAGLVVPLDPTIPRDYLKAAGASGLGVAPTVVQIDDAVSGGGRFRRSKRDKRTIVMPVVTFGTDRQDVEDKLRYLVRTLQDTYTSPKLVAVYPNGTVFDAEVHYTGGADHQWGSGDTNGQTYCRWTLQLTSPDSYFTSRSQRSFKVQSAGSRGLLRGSLVNLRLSSSQSLGTISVDNPGDVEAWPTWLVEGPGDGFTAVRARDGVGFEYVGRIQPGSAVTINTRRKTIRDESEDVNLYGGLRGAPKFFSVPPGQSTIAVQLLNSTSDSKVNMSFAERRELIF